MIPTTIETPDGATLCLRAWSAPAPGPRGTVLVVHGLGEHIGRYAHVAEYLVAAGWGVVGYDQRGHGASSGPRGGLPADDSLLCDLGRVIDVVQGDRTEPLVLLGHSMGGLVAGRYVAEGLASPPAPWWRRVDALVMSSPALDPGMSAVQKALLAVLGRLAPGLAVGNGLDPGWVSRDPAVVQAYRSDPSVHDRVTARLVRFIVDGGRVVRDLAPRWKVPTLLLYAGADRCVAPRGSAQFASAAPVGVLQAHRFDGLAHEIFNEPERRQVLERLGQWLGAQFA